MKKFVTISLFIFLTSLYLLSGCSSYKAFKHKETITLTMWHNFGGEMQTTMDNLIDEFNNTVGKDNDIFLTVTSVSSSASIQEKLNMIVSGDPGAPEMPDIATCYPQTAISLAENKIITPLDKYFSESEISLYLPRFIEEGKIYDGNLYVFPFAKSTEVLFLNQTIFDRFSKATGISVQSLATFEGISKASMEYYKWTDDQTPDIANDGKNFFKADSIFNTIQVGMKQLGDNLIETESLKIDSQKYKHILNCIYEPAIKGGYAIYNGYSSDLSKTGEIVCSTGSTAGILFYGSKITYPDNTTEEVKYTILPFPVFEKGNKIAIQRGGGMIVASSTPEKEKAASIFLKWFTSPTQNMQFVASTGYLPVTKEAFGNSIEQEINTNENENIKKLLKTAISVYKEYDFYITPVFDTYNSLSKEYESNFEKSATEGRKKYLELLNTMNSDSAYEQILLESTSNISND